MRAEAVSNTYLTGPARLSEDACQTLQALGWRPPTYVPADGAPPPRPARELLHRRHGAGAVRPLGGPGGADPPDRLPHPAPGRPAVQELLSGGGGHPAPHAGDPRELMTPPRYGDGMPATGTTSRDGPLPDDLLAGGKGAKPLATEAVRGAAP